MKFWKPVAIGFNPLDFENKVQFYQSVGLLVLWRFSSWLQQLNVNILSAFSFYKAYQKRIRTWKASVDKEHVKVFPKLSLEKFVFLQSLPLIPSGENTPMVAE